MASTYEPIASTTLGSSAATYTFSSIPGTFTDLVLLSSLRGDRSGVNWEDVWFRFNSDTGTNYSRTYLYGNGSSAGSGRDTSASIMRVMYIPGSLAASNIYSADKVSIFNYSSTNVFKTVLGQTNTSILANSNTVGLWRSTAAITSITIGAEVGNLVSGSTLSLFGVKAA